MNRGAAAGLLNPSRLTAPLEDLSASCRALGGGPQRVAGGSFREVRQCGTAVSLGPAAAGTARSASALAWPVFQIGLLHFTGMVS